MRKIMNATILLLFVIGLSLSAQTEDDAIIRSIFDEALTEGESWDMLNELCEIGNRLTGSPGSLKSVEWAKKRMTDMNFDKVYTQEMMVPVWVRGEKETAAIYNAGKKTNVSICALGYSEGTGDRALKAPVVEVTSIEQVEEMTSDELKGKIVFYNRPMDPRLINTFHAYGGCVDQRSNGALKAQKKGAVGMIVRSMTLKLDDYPHTGTMNYGEELPKIPAAAISTKGAALLHHSLKDNPDLEFEFKMNCKNLPETMGYNVIGEIIGTEKPDEIIVVSGHLDAWDIAEGAHDDGAGCVQSMEILRMIDKLELKPKHTIRCVLYMNEENGTRGARKYAEVSKENNEVHIAAIESDCGGFAPRGFNIDGSDLIRDEALEKIQSWEEILEPYNLHHFKRGFSGVDINFLKDQDIPLIGFYPDSQRYFDFHHTEIDLCENVNKRELELGAASIASLVYLIDKYGLVASANSAD